MSTGIVSFRSFRLRTGDYDVNQVGQVTFAAAGHGHNTYAVVFVLVGDMQQAGQVIGGQPGIAVLPRRWSCHQIVVSKFFGVLSWVTGIE